MGSVIIGVDPDLHNCPYAVIDLDGEVIEVGLARVPKTVTGTAAVLQMILQFSRVVHDLAARSSYDPEAIVIEGQQIYNTGYGRTQGLDAILKLGQVAGGCVSSLDRYWDACAKIMMPKPVEWKGSVKKGIKQSRILRQIGLEPLVKADQSSARPLNDPSWGTDGRDGKPLKNADWTHVVDAIGLALWGLEKFKAESLSASKRLRLA